MHVTPGVVATERDRLRERERVVTLINDTRAGLESEFDSQVDRVTVDQYREAVDEVFADGDRAVNVAALAQILRNLDVTDDYPGFVVDEFLGRELAGTIAGEQPLRMLGEATFHYADVRIHGAADEAAGADDLDAALAAGFQTRLPGWEWRESASPFGVDPDAE